jgi:hypothetical protein
VPATPEHGQDGAPQFEQAGHYSELSEAETPASEFSYTEAPELQSLDSEHREDELDEDEALDGDIDAAGDEDDSPLNLEVREAREATLTYHDDITAPPAQAPDEDVRLVLESGIREISGEVRNSLEFHRSQEDGGEVLHVALSGSALDIPGFAEALQISLGVEVHSESVGLLDESLAGRVSIHRLAVATGLAASEAPQ